MVRNLVLVGALLACGVGLAWAVSLAQRVDPSTIEPTAVAAVLPEEFPSPPPVPAGDRTLDRVPLAQTTRRAGILVMVQEGVPVTASAPFGYAISLQDGTIVDVVRDDPNGRVWVALTFEGATLTRKATGDVATNYGGGITPLYAYTGLTVWVELDKGVIVTVDGSRNGEQGLGAVDGYLIVGQTMSFNAQVDDGGQSVFRVSAAMNRSTLALLDQRVGNSQPSRLDQTYRFRADFAVVTSWQPTAHP